MNANPATGRLQGADVVVVAVLSALIAIGIATGVTDLFQSRGEPMGELAAAERACVSNVYVSERESCMREWIAVAHGYKVARR